MFQPANSVGCNEFSRLFQPARSIVCRVTKIDSFSSRLCQTPNSSGCFIQRAQPVVSANEIKRSASMIVLSMTIVIVMFWRWRCLFLFPSVPVHLTLTIRSPRGLLDTAATQQWLFQPGDLFLPVAVAGVTPPTWVPVRQTPCTQFNEYSRL